MLTENIFLDFVLKMNRYFICAFSQSAVSHYQLPPYTERQEVNAHSNCPSINLLKFATEVSPHYRIARDILISCHKVTLLELNDRRICKCSFNSCHSFQMLTQEREKNVHRSSLQQSRLPYSTLDFKAVHSNL